MSTDWAPAADRVLRLRGDRISVRVKPRAVTVCVVLAALAAVVGALSLVTGEFTLPFGDVVATLLGSGSGRGEFVVMTLRLPRWLTALTVGAALAISGAIFQQLTNNPLGSPDIIGFSTGAATGALVVLLVFPSSPLGVAGGALVGGLLTAMVVYLLTLGRGTQGYRLILIGIGVSAVLTSLNSYLITRATLLDALAAQAWLVGSLNGRTWTQLGPLSVFAVVLIPVALLLGRRLALLEMGDDAARSRGLDVGRTKLVLIVVAVALTAAATATAGPIAFIALAAPQLARRLTRSPAAGLFAAALTGALLLTLSDLVTQRSFSENPIPVGYATGAIGGLYLAWLLAKQWRGGRM